MAMASLNTGQCAVPVHCLMLPRSKNTKFAFGSGNVTVARVGFTADLGYEVWYEPELNRVVEQAIRKAEVALSIKIDGYGLKALNALRLEGGFIVPG